MWRGAASILLLSCSVWAAAPSLDGLFPAGAPRDRTPEATRPVELSEGVSRALWPQKRSSSQSSQERRRKITRENAANAAGQANVLLVNPTHVAIAIDYDRETCPVPTLSAKGEDDIARAMREAAEAAGVPIVRNIPLARDLLARGEEGEIIPRDLFEVMAEVILWAKEVREDVQSHVDPLKTAPRAADRPRRNPPGEDLTRYPDGLHAAPSGPP